MTPILLVAAAIVSIGIIKGGENSAGGLRLVSEPVSRHLVQVPPDNQKTSAIPAAPSTARPRPMPICGNARRVNCVVDGDTFWLGGEKFRVENIDAPEVHGRCRDETNLATKATRRLSAILSGTTIKLERNGYDRFGRTLVTVRTSRGEVGSRMVREGLARVWADRRLPWCDI